MAKEVKQKRCKVCPMFFKPYKSTDMFCSHQCSKVYFDEKEVEKRFKEAQRAINDKLVYTDLQNAINKIVRLIDRGHECMTSKAKYGTYEVNAGHFFAVGSNPAIRYNLLNIFNQSQNDNFRKGGKGSNYGLRLKEVFGEDIRNEIEGLVAKYPSLHLSKPEAREALKKARQIIKELEQVDIVFSTEYRIEVRRKLNERIGIYK
jgi:hypothetical protein